jgi:CPA2 family monovalent cation:H+ antiporter-2
VVQHEIPYLREIVIFLIAAGIVVPVFHRLKMSPVLGYLIIGGIIGPYGLGLFLANEGWLSLAVISNIEGVRRLASLGVIFLLFMIGLELSLDRIWSMRRYVFGLGGLQVVLTGATIAAAAAWLGAAPETAAVLGACLAFSSTAMVMQLLSERRQLGTPLGRTSFAILLFQDLSVVPILFMVGVFGVTTDDEVWTGLLLAILKAAAAIIAIVIVGRLILRPLFRMVSQTGGAEMFMAAALLVVIGAAAITGATGSSMELGAFLAGLLLAETEYRHEIEIDIAPFKGLLLGLFFMSVGMGIDYRLVGEHAHSLLAALIALFAVKAAIIFGLMRAFRFPAHTALETGLLLGQAGEFAFVVVALARSVGMLPGALAHFVFIVVGLGIVATPFLAPIARRLAAILEHRAAERAAAVGPTIPEGLEGHIVIAGFGRVGRTIGALCDAEGLPYLALDMNATNIAEGRREDLPIFFGDASRLEMLRRTRLAAARALVVTTDSVTAAEHIVRKARLEFPDLPIYARARNRAHARVLLSLGASEVVPESLESSLQLAGRVLAASGCPDDVVARHIDAQRTIELDQIKG